MPSWIAGGQPSDLCVVGVIHTHPEVRLHARGELAQQDRMLRDADDRDDFLALEAVAVDLGVLRVFDLLVGNVLVVGVPCVPADDERERGLLADLLGTLLLHGIEGRFYGSAVREFRIARDDALASGDGFGVRGVHVVDNPLDHPVEILLLAAADLDAARRIVDPSQRLAALARSPDGVADVLVLLVHQKTQHRGLELGIELAEDEFAVRLREHPILLVVARIELQIDHGLLRFEVLLGELVLVLPALALGAAHALECGGVVLNDVAQLDGRQRVFVLYARFDVDEPLAEGVFALGREGQEVLEDLAVIAVL